ncbi:MAG: TatD family hydrolase [Bacteroidia bacterium]|nr:TatD family hydrolase [Bacteroidia bacterium]
MFIDTHTHIYAEQFDTDRSEAIKRAVNDGIKSLLLPAIDKSTQNSLLDCVRNFPENCLPMTGLHPTSVKENYLDELDFVKNELKNNKYHGIGETGLDYYWDKTYIKEQEIALRVQIELALEYSLPIVLHSRKSLNELFNIIREYKNTGLTGVFHCFPGNIIEAQKAIDFGFYLGIGGVVTYKNSDMAEVAKNVSLSNIILETDSPYLTPAPFRGKRNESLYIKNIAEKIAELKNITLNEVAEITTKNAKQLFKLS